MREMKGSGVAWIGEIPKEWEVRKVKDLYTLQTGFTPDTKNEDYYSDDGFDWVTIGDFNGTKYIPPTTNKHISPKFIELFSPESTPKGSLLYSFKLSVGQVAVADREVYTNEAIASFLTNDNVNLDFLFYSSCLIIYNANVNIYGAKILNQKLIQNAPIVFPPLAEQGRIAEVLDAACSKVDALIANQSAQIEKLRAYRQSLITETVTKGLDPEAPMKHSGVEWIGDIPEGWEVIKAARIIKSTQNGLTRRSSTDTSGEIVLKLKNISADGTLDYSDINRISLTLSEKETYALYDGDFLFVRVNGSKKLVGKCAIYSEFGETVAYNDHIIRVRINDICNAKYFRYYLISAPGKIEIDKYTSTSAGQYTISGEGLRNIWVVVPPLEVQAELVSYLDAQCAKIDALIALKQQKIDRLGQYKKSLIYEYVTGKKEA